jgi:hypothetical protein
MSNTGHKVILLVVAAGIVAGGGIGFLGGFSGWGILAGVVLGICGAAGAASILVGHFPLTEEIKGGSESEPPQQGG